MTDKQCSINKEVSLKGIGIHTGKYANIRLCPAPADSGIVFFRTDLPGTPGVPAHIDYATDVKRGTTVEKGPAKVQTVEHLLAALYGLGIDNLHIYIDSEELPVGDGSSADYVNAILSAGIAEQEKEKTYFTPDRIISYKYGDTELIAVPSDKFSISSTIHYSNSKILSSQFLNIDINETTFQKDIASARTFCFEREIRNIIDIGLGKGGTVENTIVIGDEGITNTTLRFADEFVRHKILDLIGDLYLLGVRLRAHVIAVRSGHAANVELAKKLKENYLIVKSRDTGVVLDADMLLKTLPHRFPFLLVDRIEMDASHKIATGYKHVTLNEPYLAGHYPGHPVFPRALIVEFIAQSSAVMLLSDPALRGKLAFFIVIENVKFFEDVLPFSTMISKVEMVRGRARGGKVRGAAYSCEKKVAEAEFMFTLIE